MDCEQWVVPAVLQSIPELANHDSINQTKNEWPLVYLKHHLSWCWLIFFLYFCLVIRQKPIRHQACQQQQKSKNLCLLSVLTAEICLRVKKPEHYDSDRNHDSYQYFLWRKLVFLAGDTRAEDSDQNDRHNIAAFDHDGKGEANHVNSFSVGDWWEKDDEPTNDKILWGHFYGLGLGNSQVVPDLG